jgi:hypothetical protein
VRFVRCKPGPCRYSVSDARAAIERYRGEIEARRARAAELEASQRAAKAAKIAASQVAPPEVPAAVPRQTPKPMTKPTPVQQTPISKARSRSPEVAVSEKASPRVHAASR